MKNDRVNSPQDSTQPKAHPKKTSERSMKERIAMVEMANKKGAGCLVCAYEENCEYLPPCSTCYFYTHDPDSTDNSVFKKEG